MNPSAGVMVEVFKTNVWDTRHANQLLDLIHQTFTHYTANFDLEDCDRILRIHSSTGLVEACFVISLVQDFGFTAEVLPDDAPLYSPDFLVRNPLHTGTHE
ncbi:hypothetical protein [Larkinella sp. C7]|jgi:hypothetical protein|uniref:hypothetical protein n=1 Tax=Larkinella sp. C7 TaxID=2576607 RepID=UPI001BB27D0D|nr:hypothetical protein [Larkinella sp. C7]